MFGRQKRLHDSKQSINPRSRSASLPDVTDILGYNNGAIVNSNSLTTTSSSASACYEMAICKAKEHISSQVGTGAPSMFTAEMSSGPSHILPNEENQRTAKRTLCYQEKA